MQLSKKFQMQVIFQVKNESELVNTKMYRHLAELAELVGT